MFLWSWLQGTRCYWPNGRPRVRSGYFESCECNSKSYFQNHSNFLRPQWADYPHTCGIPWSHALSGSVALNWYQVVMTRSWVIGKLIIVMLHIRDDKAVNHRLYRNFCITQLNSSWPFHKTQYVSRLLLAHIEYKIQPWVHAWKLTMRVTDWKIWNQYVLRNGCSYWSCTLTL